MKRTFFALLLSGLILSTFVSGGNDEKPKPDTLSIFKGEWVFEKAEYMERSSPTQAYKVKYVIDSVKGLEAIASCIHQTVKRITIDEVVFLDCPFSSYCGRAVIVTVQEPEGDKHLLTIGIDPEDFGKDAPIADVKFNIIGLTYWIEKVDDETISMTAEAICMENAVKKDAAVKCILKKVKF